ncbi:TMEM175 family protein [Streptomyces sp. AK02-01A]|nr:TMEM175 family protein [Streptomyces sp. AK02-01A]
MLRGYRHSDTGRVEAFSDAVFAIAMTILVLELGTPPHRTGELGRALIEQWPSYLGFAASFSYISVLWLNHHQAFARIRVMDRGLQACNLVLLGATVLLAFPTGVVAETLRERSLAGSDARVSVALYAAVGAAMCASWVLLYAHLHRHPALLRKDVEPQYVRLGVVRATLGVVVYALAGIVGALVHPVIALTAFLVLPVFYFLTSEGFFLAGGGTSSVSP